MPPIPRRRRLPTPAEAASWAFAAWVLALLAATRLGDRWWLPTVLLYLPRWLWLAPLPVLAGVARRSPARRGAWSVQAIAALLVLGPYMGFNLPIGREGRARGVRFRVLTLNREGDAVDERRLAALVGREDVSLILFQEPSFRPGLDYLPSGWVRDRKHLIVTRFQVVREWDWGEPWFEYGIWPVRMGGLRLRTPEGAEFVAASVHFPTIRPGFERLARWDIEGLRDQVAWRLHQRDRLLAGLDEMGGVPLLFGGDFNATPDSPLFDPIRARFRSAFERAGWGYGYTRPTALPWARIDQLWVGDDWAVSRCWVGPDLGADHLPVLAEVVLRDRP
ncbi:MAG TPA: endonuclease/exonuclease/phosphatase family protein [Isosphaeraceae bacterium]|nr:endonuclease/exonuclease/phosphatase family protein [Isosphaeraceae bacterium]